ncbi:hypothetical protein [Gelidibacter salicanalis]|uniref:Uncharacterized protein n=1 Tax=Gelidibacter salicanalis TaxID=291193 RepID=A0A934KRD5_9FLAO|nr:hypothetical protein [Gelidibacter salicanalis]MBJ7880685.1 hypothetical protein [Gelidibacter salicanalis]
MDLLKGRARTGRLLKYGENGSLTNFIVMKLVYEYMMNRNKNLILKYYLVEQIVANGAFKETGSSIRLDFDFKF